MKNSYDFTELPDSLWEQVEPILAPLQRKRSGGSPATPFRKILNGIIYRLKTGCQWSMIPRCYGSKSVIHEHYQRWVREGVFDRILLICLEEYQAKEGIELSWQSMDGTLIQAPVRGKKRKG